VNLWLNYLPQIHRFFYGKNDRSHLLAKDPMSKLLSFFVGTFFFCYVVKAQHIFFPYQSQIKQYVIQKKMNDRICFLIDLNIHNGKKRFFVYDIQKDSILHAGLVTHGDCKERYLSDVRYSNQPGSQCSSVGKYKVGVQYKGIFGKSYRLHGLDSTNNNALKRAVVIHSHDCIPEKEIYPNQICNSQGCATVAPAFLTTISSYIDQSKKPILLWVLDRR